VDANPHDPAIAAHIESVAARADADEDRLVARMLGGCWPGGMGDRTNVVAVEWVRRWGPQVAVAVTNPCRCAIGHCPVCN
jgi:hypothetical protein